MTTINAYLGLNGQCREAMTFYKECLGGELTFQVIGESPIASQFPANMHTQILHSSLMKDGMVLMATDCVGPDGYSKGNNISLSLNCSSEEEINTFYKSLSAGGKIIEPLKKQFWGALFAVFTDKYGIPWMLNYDQKQG